jgi:hypothetical protein
VKGRGSGPEEEAKMTTNATTYNPWAPYADYDAYYAAKWAIAQVLGFVEGGEATEVAKTYGQSTVYTLWPSGKHVAVTWDATTGAKLVDVDEAGNIK